MLSVSNDPKNPATERAIVSVHSIFQTNIETKHATAQDSGSAFFAGQLNPTIHTTVNKIGIAAINAYICEHLSSLPLFLYPDKFYIYDKKYGKKCHILKSVL